MFNLITWNIQWGRGCDGVVNLQRIVDTARGLADFDVLCLQEVASNFPGLAGSTGEDQPAVLARLLPGYTPAFGAGTDVLAEDGAPASREQGSRLRDATGRESGAAPSSAGVASISGVTSPKGAPVPPSDGARRLFGNMILSRLPVVQVFRHMLPWPVDPDETSMQRVLVEAVIEAPFGALRVMTTHLEYYSALQRAAQVERIRKLHAESALRARRERARDSSAGPFRSMRRAASAVLTADFNFRPDDPLHDRVMAPCGEGVPAFRDAWQVCHPGVPHPPSLGVFDREQWPDGGYCCDFVYVSEDLCPRMAGVRIDQQTAASDHQPVILTLNGDAR
jgi:endonuclease/exonuclease/phosphatase family metal-dependent hydrolase